MAEEFILRVAYSTSPDHLIRRGEVMADVGLPPPDPPLTSEEMERVTFAAKMEVLRQLRRRTKQKRAPIARCRGSNEEFRVANFTYITCPKCGRTVCVMGNKIRIHSRPTTGGPRKSKGE